jgi:antitoxin (DNA-binding transcriptional repressor) of toxin-antitoxin stability system
MRTISAGQLRARLGEALDRASAGERIVVERDHHLIAAIVPLEDVQRLEGRSEEAIQRRLAAMARIEERAERMRRLRPQEPDGPRDAVAAVRWERDHGHEDGG